MSRTNDRGDWCERLAAAIADGRFLEDPSLWRAHVEGCAVCRQRVEGLFDLRERIQRASLEVPVEPLGQQSGSKTIEQAFRRFRRQARIRNAAVCVAVLLLGGVALLVARGHGDGLEADPVAYATRLHRAVFGEGSTPDYGLLARDTGLREEYLRALDHPSSFVRRTALGALTLSGIDLGPDRLAAVLRDWREDLESPIEVAAASGEGRWLSDALASRRAATILALLRGAYVEAARGHERVPAEDLAPFLAAKEVEERKMALRALSFDPTYRPGPEVEALLALDPAPDVRTEAASCLLSRRGEEGAAVVVARLEGTLDEPVEEAVLPKLAKYEASVALSRRRVASGATPVLLALHHLRALEVRAPAPPPIDLVARALASQDPAALEVLAYLASSSDWRRYREPLQASWRAVPSDAGLRVGSLLVAWDRSSGEEPRLLLSLEIIEALRAESLRAAAVDLTASDSKAVRERAKRLVASWPLK